MPEPLQKFEDIISYIESESGHDILNINTRIDVYLAIVEARKLINESGSCGRGSELSKTLRDRAVRRIHPVYMKLNIDYEVLSELIGRSPGWFTLRFRELGLERKSNEPRIPRKFVKYYCDTAVFESWGHEMAYWLGFIWADGHVRVSETRYHLRVVVRESDADHLKLLKRFLKTNIPVKREFFKPEKGGKPYPQAVLCINRKDLANSLEKYNVFVGRSVKDVAFPEIPKEFIWDFVRGYFDGDGAIHRPQICVFRCSGWVINIAGSKRTLETLRAIVYRDTGTRMDLRLNGKSQNNYVLSRSGPAIFGVLARLYPENATLGLERKKRVILGLLEYYDFAALHGVTVVHRGDGTRFLIPKAFTKEGDDFGLQELGMSGTGNGIQV